MKTEDILVMAKAGFTAQQIAAFNAVQNTSQSTAAQTAQQATSDPMKTILEMMQLQNMVTATQPPAQTTDDILASIINPPTDTHGGAGK